MNNNPLITIVDSIPFISNVYEGTTGSNIKLFDLIRFICSCLLILTIVIRIIEKFYDYKEAIELKKKKEKKMKKKQGIGEEKEQPESNLSRIWKITISTVFSPKNIILILAFLFNFVAYQNYNHYYLNSLEIYKDTINYVDLYQFAKNQKFCRTVELLSLYLFGIYSIKYLQYIQPVQILFRAFKKSAFEYFAIIVSIAIIFLGLSILTNFVFGSYIYEYKNFLDSLIMNLKVFIFVENTTITGKFMEFYRLFSIIVLILFVFLIKYFSLNLFLPVLVEYYRNEFENNQNSINLQNKANEEEISEENLKILTWKDSKLYFNIKKLIILIILFRIDNDCMAL